MEKSMEVKKKTGFVAEIHRNAFLYGMTVPGVVLTFIFAYIPMIGLVMAFQDYNIRDGFHSKFCGLANFKFITNPSIWSGITTALGNTLLLNILFLIFTTFCSVVLAIAFTELHFKKYSKCAQSISLLPYFLSWTVISLMLDLFINPSTGLLRDCGINFYKEASVWRPLLVGMKIWQSTGYTAIVYLATITGIDPGIMEAADIDGANRWQKIIHITLPLLRPTIILMVLFSVGKIFNGDFGMIYALVGDNSALYPTTDVVDTYVYRMMRQMQNYGLTTAIGLLQSVCGLIFVVGANALAKKIEPDSAIF